MNIVLEVLKEDKRIAQIASEHSKKKGDMKCQTSPEQDNRILFLPQKSPQTRQ